MKRRSTIGAVLLAACVLSGADHPDRVITYKQVGDVELTLHLFTPPGHSPDARVPAMVFFNRDRFEETVQETDRFLVSLGWLRAL